MSMGPVIIWLWVSDCQGVDVWLGLIRGIRIYGHIFPSFRIAQTQRNVENETGLNSSLRFQAPQVHCFCQTTGLLSVKRSTSDHVLSHPLPSFSPLKSKLKHSLKFFENSVFHSPEQLILSFWSKSLLKIFGSNGWQRIMRPVLEKVRPR